MTYNFYPAVDENFNFPPVVREALTNASELKAAFVETGELIINVKDYGAKGDGVTDDSNAIVAALSAAEGRALYFPKGTYVIASAVRLQVYASYTSLIGDPSGITTLRFINAAGGVDIGDGTDFIYQNVIQNLVLDGFNIATTLLRLRKSEELGIDNVRIHQALTTCIEATDTSLLHATRLQIARAPIGIRLLGYAGTIGLIDMNAYLLDAIISVEGTGLSHCVVSGTSFIEGVKVGVSFNRPGALISIGSIAFRDCYVTSALTEFSLFKAVASTGINASMLAAFGLNAYIPLVTTSPIANFSAVNNNGSTVRIKVSDSVFTATALGAGKLVSVNAAQNWYQFFLTVRDIVGITTLQYATVFVTGGVALTPLRLDGSGTPEGVQTAPVGSTYHNYGGYGPTAMYVKHLGNGNTGWVSAGSLVSSANNTLYRIGVTDDGNLTASTL